MPVFTKPPSSQASIQQDLLNVATMVTGVVVTSVMATGDMVTGVMVTCVMVTGVMVTEGGVTVCTELIVGSGDSLSGSEREREGRGNTDIYLSVR